LKDYFDKQTSFNKKMKAESESC